MDNSSNVVGNGNAGGGGGGGGTGGGGNSNIHTIVKAQIVFLLSTLTEDNFERNQLEIRSLSEQHGLNIYLHFIRRLIVHSQSRLLSAPAPSVFESSSLTFRLLIQETQRLSRDPFLADRFREGIDKAEGDAFRNFDLVKFVERVGLRPLEKLILASSVASGAMRRELEFQAANIIRREFDDAVYALCQTPCFDREDLSIPQTAKLLSNLLAEPPSGSTILDAPQRQALILAMQTKFGPETVSPTVQRLVLDMSLPQGMTLVQTLVMLGPEISGDFEVIKAVLSRFGTNERNPPTDAFVSDVIGALARLTVEGPAACDVGALVLALSSFSPNLDWAQILQVFDMPDRLGVDTATLKLLIAILQNSPEAPNPAVAGFWTTWDNTLYQLKLLDALLSLPSDTFNFVTLSGRRVVTVDEMASASPTIKSLAANVQGSTWNSLDLFEVLVRSGESSSSEVVNCVREMLDKAVKISADLVHMGLLQTPRPWTALQEEYSQRLLSMFLAGHPNHQLVFMRIWQIEPSYLTNALRSFYDENPMNITRILDIAQDLKILDSLLDVRPFTFALDVAALASRREYLNLDKWLADNVSTHGAEFLHAVITFLDSKVQNEKAARMTDPSGGESRTMALNPQTIAIFLRVLRNNSSVLSDRDRDYCLEVRNSCLQMYPRLMSLVPGSDQDPGFSVVTYSNEIEAEVDGIYKQMYDENIGIDGVIQLLRRTKESSNPRDHEIFSCMLHFLFDEYRFFQSYPPRELLMTGYLFGSLIQHQLVDHIPLGIAIRYVLDALKCPPDSNLFKFGIQALARFESRLPEWRPLCQALFEIPHLMESRADVADTVRRVLAAAPVESSKNTLSILSTFQQQEVLPLPVDTSQAFAAIDPDHLNDGTLEPPPEEVSDKILFIINNLAPSNFDAKTTEMVERFKDDYSRWFAHYLVDQRVSTEQNNHKLYLRFLDALDRPLLDRFVLHETFEKSAVVLNSEKTLQSSAERTILKNLGSWLGQITLARDKPIKHKNLSFKDLLIEGAESNRLIVAIPFVCKILESCAQSKVFKPPNPWLMAVISLLAELYHFAELKLNMKFEIEVLCKSLDIDLDKVEVSSILRDRPLAESLTGPPLPDYVPDIDSLPIGGYDQPGQVPAEHQVLSLSSAEAQRAVGTHIENILSNLMTMIVVNQQIAQQLSPLNFKRAVHVAVDRAVREIILPVVERSVTIAGISSRQLVAKDFAAEPDEERVRKAAHLMAQRLAGSLALVTCKEPLKSNMASHLRNCLVEAGYNEHHIHDQMVLSVVQENIEAACSAIEKAAMDRAVADIDEQFAMAYDNRRRHREVHPGQAFWDPAAPPHPFTQTLPDPLQIKPSGPLPQQLRVYEDFSQDGKRRAIISRPSSAVSYVRSEHLQQTGYSPSPGPENLINPGGSWETTLSLLTTLMASLDVQLLSCPYTSIQALPPGHEIRVLVRNILQLAYDSQRPRMPLQISQKIVQMLYRTPSQLGRDLYAALLEQLCRTYEDVEKEAINWLIYAEDDRKFNVPVTLTLLRSQLISVPQQDQQLAKFLYTNPKSSLQDYIAGLIRGCLSADPPLSSQDQFTFVLEALGQIALSNKATPEVTRLLEDLRVVRRPTAEPQATQPSAKANSEQMETVLLRNFQQWVSIFQRSPTPEKAFVPYITHLTKQGILKAEDVSFFFFRVSTEASINHYFKFAATGEFKHAYLSLDAMSRLFVYIIKYHGDASGENNEQAKVHYLTKILSIVVVVLASRHEEPGFDQKPFFRFFSSFMSDLYNLEMSLGTTYFQILIALSETFSSLQPMYFPGFAFSWMTLISHRLFMPKLLHTEDREGWAAYHQLLLSLFRFLAPFLEAAHLQTASRDLYRGTLRLLLVLLHDFPDFLSEYYFTLCDSIPPRCIQLRNIILSAFPASITLPDPHQRNLKSDTETQPIPPILSDFTSALKSGDLRNYLDQFLLNRSNQTSLSAFKELLRVAPAAGSDRSYNLQIINAVVMYIGVSSVAQAKARSGYSFFSTSDPGVVVLSYLASNLDAEGQHHLISAMILHLRYPNAHTQWFSSLMIHLFAEVQDDCFREIMTKVLLERFLVHRPHPWGALVTFIELLRNQKYDFWNKDFVRIAPEVTVLLESVARSVFQP